jgi:hypothetical protein
MAPSKTFRNLCIALTACSSLAMVHASDKEGKVSIKISEGAGAGAGAGTGATARARRKQMLERSLFAPAEPSAASAAPTVDRAARERMVEAIYLQDADQLKQELSAFMKAKGDPARMVDSFGCTPLHLAACFHHLGMVKYLLVAGFSPNQMGGAYGEHTPLHSVFDYHVDKDDAKAAENRVKVVKVLVELGKADPGIPDANGKTVLVLAQEHKAEDVAKYLRERSAGKKG